MSAVKTSEKPGSAQLAKRLQAIATEVGQAGGRALLVGGYVRDRLLGLDPKDADLEVYGIEPQPLRELLRDFGRVDTVGESFQVYKLVWRDRSPQRQRHEIDVSIPRTDRKVGTGHRGFLVEGNPHATVEEAARRRDFTINAILRDPLTDELIDPFDGESDLKQGVLKAVDPRHFGEDSLRVLRAAQFAARFGLKVEADTAALCRTIPLNDLPHERVWGEWEKVLLKAQQPSRGLEVANDLLILSKLAPRLEVALGRRGDEMLRTVDGAARERDGLPHEKQVTLMLAALAVFLGWRGLDELLEAWNIHSLHGYDVRTNTKRLAGERNRVRRWYRRRDAISDTDFRYLSARCEPNLIYRLARARGDIEAAEWFIERMRALGVAEGPPPPLLMGRHLLEMGLQPGPRIGEITRAVYLKQLGGEVTTLEEAIDAAKVSCR